MWQFILGLIIGANVSLFVYALILGGRDVNERDE